MGKELVMKAMRHEAVERAPWVPFSGIHSGKLKGYSAKEVLNDGQKLYESLMEVAKLYTPDGMPIMFDLQLEAEILGCDLLWSEDNAPSVRSHPFSGKEKTLPCQCLMPTAESGRIPVMLEAMEKIKASVGDDIALYGLICGPLTLASHLRGTRFFMDMVKDPDYVKSLIEYCARYAIKMAQLYMDAGMDIIAVVDPIVSQVSPKHFEALVSDSYKALFDYIRSQGCFSSFFVCGNATLQLEVMCHTMPDSIAVDENVDLVSGKAITDKYNITISGNIPLTTVMLHGTQQDNMKLVVDLLDKMDSTTNLIVSPGCDMPYDVPIENTIACAQAALNTETAREIIKNYVAVDDDIEVVLPDYEHLEKPLVEVFTLDSVQCAACTYMMAAANEAKAIYGDKIDVVEYKYIYKESIARTKKMGLTNLPTMCVNGEIKFVSLIPTIQELSAAIDAKL